jgi:prepilin-type N-terminal cleavage/methylation domain-containing protein
MISAARTTDRRNGFTLIEIVMVIAIAAVVMGGAVGLMVYSSDERALRDGSGEIELLAKRARIISIRQQTPYALEFRPGTVRLLPLAEAGVIERTTGSGRSIGGEVVEPEGQNRVRDAILLDPSLSIFIRRWNSEAWLPMSENLVHVWRFDPDGLCEPISVRLTTTSGSWNEDYYHPLTATIRDSEMEAR